MTRPQNNEVQQLEVQQLEDFALRLTKDFNSRIASGAMDQLSVDQVGRLIKMPYQLKQMLAGIKNKNLEQRAEVAQQLFVIACASQIPLEDALKFKEDAGLNDKVLNDFGPENKGELNPLAAALAGGRSNEDLDKLFKAGADINFKSPDGNNAAHFAVMFGVEAETLQHLIDRGVEVNAANNMGLTPFDLALIKQAETGVESPLIEVLRKNGAEISLLSGLAENEKSAAQVKGKIDVKATDKRKKRDSIREEEDDEDEEKKAKKDGAVTIKQDSAAIDDDEKRKNLSPQAKAALTFLANSGVDIKDLQDQRLIMQAALDEAVRRGSETLTLQLLTMGAEPSAKTFELAFANRNMNLVCQLSMHADRAVLQVVEIKAHQIFPEAEAFIHAVESRGNIVGAKNAVLEEAKNEIEKGAAKEEQHKQQTQEEQQKFQQKQEQETQDQRNLEVKESEIKAAEKAAENQQGAGSQQSLVSAGLEVVAGGLKNIVGEIAADLLTTDKKEGEAKDPEVEEEQQPNTKDSGESIKADQSKNDGEERHGSGREEEGNNTIGDDIKRMASELEGFQTVELEAIKKLFNHVMNSSGKDDHHDPKHLPNNSKVTVKVTER